MRLLTLASPEQLSRQLCPSAVGCLLPAVASSPKGAPDTLKEPGPPRTFLQFTFCPWSSKQSSPTTPEALCPRAALGDPDAPVSITPFGLWSPCYVCACVRASWTHTDIHMQRPDAHLLPRDPGLPAEGHSQGLGGGDAALLASPLGESHVASNDPGHFPGLMASGINGAQRHPGPLANRKPHTSVAVT